MNKGIDSFWEFQQKLVDSIGLGSTQLPTIESVTSAVSETVTNTVTNTVSSVTGAVSSAVSSSQDLICPDHEPTMADNVSNFIYSHPVLTVAAATVMVGAVAASSYVGYQRYQQNHQRAIALQLSTQEAKRIITTRLDPTKQNAAISNIDKYLPQIWAIDSFRDAYTRLPDREKAALWGQRDQRLGEIMNKSETERARTLVALSTCVRSSTTRSSAASVASAPSTPSTSAPRP